MVNPVPFAFFAAVLWGVWWIPIRLLADLGFGGSWAGVAMCVGALAPFVAALVWAGAPRLDRRAALGAVCVGFAVTTYSTAITYTEVIRVVLIFYLSPAWSKIIEAVFLDRPWRWTSTLTVSGALFGAYLILGGEVSLSGFGLGEFMALISGIAWSAGAALTFTSRRAHHVSLAALTCASAIVIGAALALYAGDAVAVERPAAAASAVAGSGLIYLFPILLLTMWSAERLPPATLTFLLTAEIIAGVLSGVFLLGEPFGPMRAAGAALIVLAAVAEVLPVLLRPPAVRK